MTPSFTPHIHLPEPDIHTKTIHGAETVDYPHANGSAYYLGNEFKFINQ